MQIYIKQNQKKDFNCNSIVDIKKATAIRGGSFFMISKWF